MKELNPREKTLAAITAIAGVIFIAWQFGLAESFDSISLGDSEINGLQSKMDKNMEALSDMLTVERNYRLLGQDPMDGAGDVRPTTAFEQFVYRLAKEQGFDYPKIRSDAEALEGAEGYQLLSVVISVEGPFDKTTGLLKSFEKAGLIFREVSLTSGRDSDQIQTKLLVSRVSKRPTDSAGKGRDALFNRN